MTKVAPPPLCPVKGKIHSTSECVSFVLFNRVLCSSRLPAPHRDLRFLGRFCSLLPEPETLPVLSSRPHIHTNTLAHVCARSCCKAGASPGTAAPPLSTTPSPSVLFCCFFRLNSGRPVVPCRCSLFFLSARSIPLR